MPSGRRRKEISAYDVANTPVQHLAAEENTKAIYKSYMTPVFEFAQKKGWTSPEYWKAIHSREPLTEPYVRQNNIKPICSSQNLEIFLTEHMDKYGRRRGPGPVSRSIVEQSLKAWQYYRLRESSRNLYGLQTITWRHDNLEFVNKSPDVLRNQTVLNLIEGFSKREHRDRQLRCVDTCTGKRHLTGHEQETSDILI